MKNNFVRAGSLALFAALLGAALGVLNQPAAALETVHIRYVAVGGSTSVNIFSLLPTELFLRDLVVESGPHCHNPDFFEGEPALGSNGWGETVFSYTVSPTAGPEEYCLVTLHIQADGVDRYQLIYLFSLTPDTLLTLSTTSATEREYDGTPFPLQDTVYFADEFGETCSPQSVDFHYAAAGGAPLDGPPADAGEYHLSATVADSGCRVRGDVLFFRIRPRALTVRPDDVSLSAGDALPAVWSVTCSGFAPGEDASVLAPRPTAAATATDTASAGAWPIRVTNTPAAPNYDVRLEEGTLTVSESGGSGSLTAPDGSYYRVEAANGWGWHSAPVTVLPTGKDGYDQISLSPGGGFAGSVLLGEEGADIVETVYLRSGDAVSGGVQIRYSLDRTPPLIESAVYSQTEGQARGILTVTAADALSGVAYIALTDDAGGTIGGVGGVFPIAQSGSYTVTVADYAGNTAVYRRAIRVDEADSSSRGTGETDGAGTSGSGAGGQSAADAETAYWNRVIANIGKAEAGGGVRIRPQQYTRVPAAVLRALLGRDVTLRIERGGGSAILLNGLTLPPPDPAIDWYTLDQLAAMMAGEAASAPAGEGDALLYAAAAMDIGAAAPEPEREEKAAASGAAAGEADAYLPPWDEVAAGPYIQETGARSGSPLLTALALLLSAGTLTPVALALIQTTRGGAREQAQDEAPDHQDSPPPGDQNEKERDRDGEPPL